MMGIGELASVVGEHGVEVDLRTRMWDHYAIAKSGFPELRPEVRAGITAFVAGINDYYAAHPDDVPAWWKRGRAVDEHDGRVRAVCSSTTGRSTRRTAI